MFNHFDDIKIYFVTNGHFVIIFQPENEKPVLLSSTLNGVSDHIIAQASLWTRPKLKEFIQHVKRDASSVIIVGRGETVTIRVPTHEHGKNYAITFRSKFSKQINSGK